MYNGVWGCAEILPLFLFRTFPKYDMTRLQKSSFQSWSVVHFKVRSLLHEIFSARNMISTIKHLWHCIPTNNYSLKWRWLQVDNKIYLWTPTMREQIKKDGFNLYIHAKITVFSGTSPARVPRKSIAKDIQSLWSIRARLQHYPLS